MKACYLSKLFYSIEVWGHGLTKVQVQSLQAGQNKILRWVTKTPPRSSSLLNLETCGLLSVRQTIIFRTLFAGIKIIQDRKPQGLYEALIPDNADLRRSVRLQDMLRRPTFGFYEDRHWRNVFLSNHLRLPTDLRNITEDIRKSGPKRKLKKWVHDNVPPFV